MHFMVSIETEGATPERRREILTELATSFAEQPAVEAVEGTYVIQVIGYGVYEHVQKQLLERAREVTDHTVRFVMTPLINRGIYHGRMNETAATTINSLTD